MRSKYLVLFLAAFAANAIYSLLAVKFGGDPLRLMETNDFLDLGNEIAQHGTYSQQQILPAIPIVFALVFSVFGPSNYIALAMLQAAATAGTVVATAETATLFRRDWFWPAGVLMAIMPNVWVWSGIFMAECIMLFFISVGQLALLKGVTHQAVDVPVDPVIRVLFRGSLSQPASHDSRARRACNHGVIGVPAAVGETAQARLRRGSGTPRGLCRHHLGTFCQKPPPDRSSRLLGPERPGHSLYA